MADTIRIRDLRHPEHADAAKAAFAAIEQLPFDFSTKGIIEAARAESDVPLFEDEELFGRLAEYVEAVLADPDYNRMGLFGTWSSLKRYLIQRSRLEALYAEHPEIDEIEIDRPLIIAGLPRSGTTHLLNLIGTDDRLRALRRWESLEPIPTRAARLGEVPDDRIANGQTMLDQQDLLIPLMTNMYDVPNDGIHEEVELQNLCLSSLLMAAGLPVTGWMHDYFARDQRPHYAFLKRALKALQFLAPKERWVLKSPQHLAWLPALVETFPDATFVVTHRDPVAVFASWVTMTCYAARLSRRTPIDLENVVEHAKLLQKGLLDGVARDHAVLPSDRVEHVYFHEFMSDDVGTLERIYARADLEMTPRARQAIRRYIDEHPRGRHGRIVYDLAADFGIDWDGVYPDFQAYLDVFPVERERPNR
ncbi:MAG: sulfotransferase [Spirochaetaceae bacterium]|nr:sulfotransferase [Myxococcales bacterium]MCB9724996.1 sulfotransferase [Spirochaetaceae bacterium]HPG24544.1 sulfotransferase [Myxococcota bacterium]